MGLSWQQGPLAPARVGRFLTPTRCRSGCCSPSRCAAGMRVRFGGEWIADSEDVVLLHEPGRYPVAYFPPRRRQAGRRWSRPTASPGTATSAPPRGSPCSAVTSSAERAAWQLRRPARLRGRAARPGRLRLAGDGRLLRGGRADPRPRGRPLPPHRHPAAPPAHLVVRDGDRVVADTDTPGRALRVRVSRRAGTCRAPTSTPTALTPVDGQTFCPYKGLAGYYDIGDRARRRLVLPARRGPRSAGSSTWSRSSRTRSRSYLDGRQLALEPGQTVVAARRRPRPRRRRGRTLTALTAREIDHVRVAPGPHRPGHRPRQRHRPGRDLAAVGRGHGRGRRPRRAPRSTTPTTTPASSPRPST